PRLVARIGEILACEYVQTYGLTETSPFLTFSLLDEGLRRLPPEEQLRLRARTGRPARGVEVRLVNPPGAERFEDVPADDATVGEVAVFAVPDETRGESVHAAVVLAAPDASTSEALIAFCRERMAHFKCPRGIDFVASLPRTGSGKIDKRALREPFWRGHARRIN